MTTQKLPGTDDARHGTGDADLTIMLAAHQAFHRDLARLVRAAAAADLADPAKRQSVAAGWELFKHELHLHHTAEDELIWPALRPRLAHNENALSVLDAMEEEHERIDPLLAAVDAAFAHRDGTPGGAVAAAGDDWPGEDRLADVIEVLASTLTGHLAHEERDGLPLIGVALTAAEWRGVGFRVAQERPVQRGRDVRLDAGRSRPPGRHRHLGPAPAPAAPALPGCLEAPLQQDPALVSGNPHCTTPAAATMEHRCRQSSNDGASLLLRGGEGAQRAGLAGWARLVGFKVRTASAWRRRAPGGGERLAAASAWRRRAPGGGERLAAASAWRRRAPGGGERLAAASAWRRRAPGRGERLAAASFRRR